MQKFAVKRRRRYGGDEKFNYSPWTNKSTIASGIWRSLTKQIYSAVSEAMAGKNCKPKLSDKS